MTNDRDRVPLERLAVYDEIMKDLVAILRLAKIPEEKIYATVKTGLMPTAKNCTKEELREWKDAVSEYRRITATQTCPKQGTPEK